MIVAFPGIFSLVFGCAKHSKCHYFACTSQLRTAAYIPNLCCIWTGICYNHGVKYDNFFFFFFFLGAQWLSGRVLDSRPKGRGFEPHWRHCGVSFSKKINPSLVLVQPRKTRPYITERLLMGCKESNQTNKI